MDLRWLHKDTIAPGCKNIDVLGAGLGLGLSVLHVLSMTNEEKEQYLASLPNATPAQANNNEDTSEEKKEEKKPVDPTHTCKICEENAWSVVMLCSHALCDSCVAKIECDNVVKCPFCRQRHEKQTLIKIRAD